MWWLSLLFPVIGFSLQYYPRFFNRYFGIDVWTRLLETDAVRQNGHKIPKRFGKQFLIPGDFDYPPAFPWVMSWVPKKLIEKYQGVVSPLFDSLTNLLVFIITMQITGNVVMALLAQAIYTFTPMIVLENSSLTPRSLGYLLFTVTFYLLLRLELVDGFGLHPVLFLAILFGTLTILSHRFATQSLVFICLAATFYFKSPLFLFILLWSFVLAIVVTNGYYLRVLHGHLNNMYFWIRNRDYRYWHQTKGNVSTKANTDFVGKIYYYLNRFAPISLFGINFWIASAFIYLSVPQQPMLTAFSAWIIFFYLLATVVLSSKHLLFIGEGQRYLEMSAVPAAIVAAYVIVQFLQTPLAPLALLAAICGNLANLGLILLVQRTGVVKDRNRSLTPEMQTMFDYINAMKTAPRIVCVPHYMTTMLVYFTKALVFVNADNKGVMQLDGVFPLVSATIHKVIKRYKISHILLKESFATKRELQGVATRVQYRSGDIVLLAITKSK